MARPRPKFSRAKFQPANRRRFIIFCEGKNTEPGYFNALKQSQNSTLIDVEITTSGAPKTIAEHAVQKAKSEGIGRGTIRLTYQTATGRNHRLGSGQNEKPFISRTSAGL